MKAKCWSVFIFFLLVVYHFGNWQQKSLLTSPDQLFVRKDITLGDSGYLHVPNFHGADSNDYELRETMGTYIGEIGYTLRYLMGASPSDWVMREKSSSQPSHFYYREEAKFQFPAAVNATLEQTAESINRVVKYYSERGVAVIVLPVPTKISVERKYLPQKISSSNATLTFENMDEDGYSVYRNFVSRVPAAVPLLDAYLNYRKTNTEDALFIPADSHWSSLGLTIAALEVLRALNPPDRQKEFTFTVGYTGSLMSPPGDFALAYQLPAGFLASRSELSWPEPIYSLAHENNKKVLGCGTRMIFVGTSYTGTHGAAPSFEDLLAKICGNRIQTSVVWGGDLYQGFKALKTNAFHFKAGDVVVWEFPIRRVWPFPATDLMLSVDAK